MRVIGTELKLKKTGYRLMILFVGLFLCGTVYAKIDLATLPDRDTVQLTIYNTSDLTLVQESRALTLKKGSNKLQFSWANTLIDPTSLEIFPLSNQGKIDVTDLVYPARHPPDRPSPFVPPV